MTSTPQTSYFTDSDAPYETNVEPVEHEITFASPDEMAGVGHVQPDETFEHAYPGLFYTRADRIAPANLAAPHLNLQTFTLSGGNPFRILGARDRRRVALMNASVLAVAGTVSTLIFGMSQDILRSLSATAPAAALSGGAFFVATPASGQPFTWEWPSSDELWALVPADQATPVVLSVVDYYDD